MSETIITVEKLSKRYTIQHRLNRHDGFRHVLEEKLTAPFRRLFGRNGSESNSENRGSSEEFWALKDVSFDVKRGEVVGIIGRNGAGKSTLLKILSRITEPTEGRIRLRGRVASLLEVGTGFHPELTGRENIFLNGAILGMSKAEIKRKFDEIVAFSEVEKFLDTPVKRYSSGMYVRLAFAVAAHLEPEILIVDEVLAVGDAEFQKKCLGKMQDVSKFHGRTVLFVSHNMAAISTLCTRGITMKNGEICAFGPVASCIEAYLGAGRNPELIWQRNSAAATRPVFFRKITGEIEGSQPSIVIKFRCEIQSTGTHKPAFLAVDISNSTGSVIMQALPTLECLIKDSARLNEAVITITLPPLIPGRYSATFWMGPHNTETYDLVESAVSFDILETPTPGRTFPHSHDHGCIVPFSSVRL